ncbi:MAG: hypothetical protein OXH84_08750, partial [Gammaproteobacteria bacterium]|nr:hypothetical protein [Gammaproteobacteria bacterium]
RRARCAGRRDGLESEELVIVLCGACFASVNVIARIKHECSDPTHPRITPQTRRIGYGPRPRSWPGRVLRRLLLRSDRQGVPALSPRLAQAAVERRKTEQVGAIDDLRMPWSVRPGQCLLRHLARGNAVVWRPPGTVALRLAPGMGQSLPGCGCAARIACRNEPPPI